MNKREIPQGLPLAKKQTNVESFLQESTKALNAMRVAEKHQSITPSDTEEYSDIKAIYVGTEGDLEIEDISGVTIVYKDVQGWFLFSPRKIKENTTAEDIVAVYY